jgi:acetyl-CoA carboxylase biotin carboxyl carrier protein
MEEKIVACGLTLSEINSLAETLRNNDLGKIRIKTGNDEIVLESEKKCPPPAPAPFMMPPMQAGMPVPPAASAPAPEQAAAKPAEAGASGGNIVKSPIVGTFYQSPSPDKPPFVKVGDTVKKGDVIMIIESMKLMNEIQSEFDGVVERILVSNGDAVEYDQPVMIIK